VTRVGAGVLLRSGTAGEKGQHGDQNECFH
jgi:hypothetical protein